MGQAFAGLPVAIDGRFWLAGGGLDIFIHGHDDIGNGSLCRRAGQRIAAARPAHPVYHAFAAQFGKQLFQIGKRNILSLGNEEAQALGVKVEKARWLILIMVALIASATVAVAGVIGWGGRVVPHFARMLVGADHRLLIPASAIIGAGYLVIIDTLARSATTSAIPLGVLTALVGAPLFVWLLRKTQAGGWRNA